MIPLLFGSWMITNGWSYVFVAIGGWLHIKWMVAAGTFWLAFLWIPFTPEKIVTVAIATFLYKLIYRKEFKMAVKTKSYLFMKYDSYFYVDKNFKIKLTKLGESIPEVKKSYDVYLKEKSIH